jgi:uncharacterized Ntn-hydrolase superfamily protein
LVPHGRAGVGAIATQCVTNPDYGPDGLDLLQQGLSADEVIARLTGADEGREKRQCIVIGSQGPGAAWTGAEAFPSFGSFIGKDAVVAGNLLAGPNVLETMMRTFEASIGSPLAEKLIGALAAGEGAGSDSRGVKSAAVKIYGRETYPVVDLRSDWSDDPIGDLTRILSAIRASDYADFFSEVQAHTRSAKSKS